MLYDWPGNIREFKTPLKRISYGHGDQLAICDLPPSLQEYAIAHQDKLLQSMDRPNSIAEREEAYREGFPVVMAIKPSLHENLE